MVEEMLELLTDKYQDDVLDWIKKNINAYCSDGECSGEITIEWN